MYPMLNGLQLLIHPDRGKCVTEWEQSLRYKHLLKHIMI